MDTNGHTEVQRIELQLLLMMSEKNIVPREVRTAGQEAPVGRTDAQVTGLLPDHAAVSDDLIDPTVAIELPFDHPLVCSAT